MKAIILRVLSLLLAMLMLMSLFAACEKKDDDRSHKKSTNEKTDTVTKDLARIPYIIPWDSFKKEILDPAYEQYGDELFTITESLEIFEAQIVISYFTVYSKDELDLSDEERQNYESILGYFRDDLISSDRDLASVLDRYPIVDEMPICVFKPTASFNEAVRIESWIRTNCPKYTANDLAKDLKATKYTENTDSLPYIKENGSMTYWMYDTDKTCKISSWKYNSETSLEIPAEFNGYKVTEVYGDILSGLSREEEQNLTTVTLPNTLEVLPQFNYQYITDVYFNGTSEEWDDLLLSIGGYQFENTTVHCADKDIIYTGETSEADY